jgi:hypothetical protein
MIGFVLILVAFYVGENQGDRELGSKGVDTLDDVIFRGEVVVGWREVIHLACNILEDGLVINIDS